MSQYNEESVEGTRMFQSVDLVLDLQGMLGLLLHTNWKRNYMNIQPDKRSIALQYCCSGILMHNYGIPYNFDPNILEVNRPNICYLDLILVNLLGINIVGSMDYKWYLLNILSRKFSCLS